MHIPLAARTIFVLVSVSARPWWLSFAPRSDCTEAAEVVCSDDCSQVMVCLGVGFGGFLPVPVATCDVRNNMKCSAENKTCAPAAQSDCQGPGDVGGGFRCHNAGSFPDPYNCQKFHLCPEGMGSSTSASCNGTSAYDPLSGECSLTTTDRVCTEGPIESCNQLGQMGVVQGNPRIYYVCMQQGSEIVPQMYLCPWGMIFDLTVASCLETPSTTPNWVDARGEMPRITTDRADATAASPWRRWTHRHSHGQHWAERRRWRSQHGRHHWVHTSTVPTSLLPWVTSDDAGNTTVPSWKLRTQQMSYRRPHSGRTRWRSHHVRHWVHTTIGSTTDLPSVTSEWAPWATLGRAHISDVSPGLTQGGEDTTTVTRMTPGKMVTSGVTLLTTFGGVDTMTIPPRMTLSKADATMIPSQTMLGRADTRVVPSHTTVDGVDAMMVQQPTLSGGDTTDAPLQAPLITMDTTVAPQAVDHDFPVVVDTESRRPLFLSEAVSLVHTTIVPSTTPKESIVIVT